RDDAPAAPPAPADRAALSEIERQLLGFALELAEEEIHARNLEIPEKDRAALTSLRRLAAEDAAGCAMPGFVGCECDHVTGCQHPATADLEPQDHPGADLFAALQHAGLDVDAAHRRMYAYAAMVLRQEKAITAPPAPADRAAVLNETADRLQRRATQLNAVWLRADQVIDAIRRIADEKAEEDRLAADAAAGVQPPTTSEAHRPRRGDAVDQWLRTYRERYDRNGESSEFWHEFDGLLDLYRLHADMGIPLDGHACEALVIGDCECLEQPAAPAAPEEQR
ncbi:hypothetical protein ABZW50_34110, partial [Streptomyces bacillaris]